jgi:hypothetical protein
MLISPLPAGKNNCPNFNEPKRELIGLFICTVSIQAVAVKLCSCTKEYQYIREILDGYSQKIILQTFINSHTTK